MEPMRSGLRQLIPPQHPSSLAHHNIPSSPHQFLCQLGQTSDALPKLQERQHLNLPAFPWSLILP